MKILYWVIAVLFVAFALVQYNDPDPLIWMLVYGVVALIYVLAALEKPHRKVALGACIATLGWALTYVPAFWDWVQMGAPSIVETMKAEKPYVELTREFLGLVLAAVASGWLAFRRYRQR
ncbi:MAG: transmembrane 220 family protein [Lewinellaceae bacterium]|nr:transmembrane 220 family protein [Lewinellaceae bacterium]